MKERRKNGKKRKLLFVLYLFICLEIIVVAYFHLSRIARNFNTQHLEMITGMYAEKMNEAMEYLKNYAKEDVKIVQMMADKTSDEILQCLEENRNQDVFSNIGFVMKDGRIFGTACNISDIKKNKLDKQALESDTTFVSDPYQSSESGSMVMTIFVPVDNSSEIDSVYVSITIEELRKLSVYDVLQDKISIHLLKADSENFITCISSDSDAYGSWNNLLLQQRYFNYNDDYSYNQWIKDMRAGKEEGQFSASLRGEETTISYRSVSSMPGWYVIVELVNRDVSDITQHFSVWGGVYGSILVGFTVLYMLTIVLMEKKDKKRYIGLSSIDPLTGILNRRAFQTELERELYKKTPGCFIFIDVDNFKSYNDTYGHNNGDLCLRHFADTMKCCFPQESILGRYGGDEFVVYLKNVSTDTVHIYMEEFQREISYLTLPTGEQVQLSASSGGAEFPEQGEDFVSLCRSADVALYDVKQNGKGAFKMRG